MLYRGMQMINVPTVKDILNKLERSAYRSSTYELLNDTFICGSIAISNRFDWSKKRKEREKTYLQIMNKHDPETQKLIADLFGMISALLSSQTDKSVGFSDYLGELYMKSETSSSRSGQFFTPYHISKLCAETLLEKRTVMRYKENDEILTMHEPASGSGGMIIAAIDTLFNRYQFNTARNLLVECADIDARCVHMTYLQLALSGVPAIVHHQDTLALKTWDTWLTPALIMQWERFEKYVKVKI